MKAPIFALYNTTLQKLPATTDSARTFSQSEQVGSKLSRPPRTRLVFEVVTVLLASVAFTAFFLYPLPLHLRGSIPGRADSQLNAYILAWVSHALAHHPTRLFDANIFYPARNTLALSENMLGSQVFFGPVYALTGNPALGYNVVLLLDFILTAAAMYLLVRWVTGSVWAATAAGLVFSFCPARFYQIGHMQLLAMEWMPLAIFFLLRWFYRSRLSDLMGFCACLLMQIYSSIYLGYMALICVSLFGLAVMIRNPNALTRRRMVEVLIGGAATALLSLPILLPYQRLQKSILDMLDFVPVATAASANPLGSYLNGAGQIYGGVFRKYLSGEFAWEKRLFIGFLVLGLSAMALPLLRQRTLQPEETKSYSVPVLVPCFVLGAFLTAACNYVLSLGPYLRLHGGATHVRMPFFWIRLLVPGMSHFRAPARFGMAAMLGVAILAGLGLQRLLRWLEGRGTGPAVRVTSALCALAILTLEYKGPQIGVDSMIVPGSVPPEYSWLAQQRDGRAIVEFPITPQQDFFDPYEEADYDYGTIFHWHPLVNAYSGYAPAVSFNLMKLMLVMPDAAAINIFNSLGVRYAVVHTDRMSAAQLDKWEQAAHSGQLSLLGKWPESAIYELRGQGCSSVLASGVQAPPISAAGKPFYFVLHLSSPGQCWTNPSPNESPKFSATWSTPNVPGLTERSFPVNLPPYATDQSIVADPVVILGRSPLQPGDYELKLASSTPSLHLPPLRVRLLAPAPSSDSENDPQGLNATYLLSRSQPALSAGDSEYIEFAASNTGTAIWLRGMRRGSVRLGYQWLDQHGKQVEDQRLDLPYDVYPGTAFTFHGQIRTPKTPGHYQLKLELVSELVTWFHDRGVSPVTIQVTIR